MGTRSARMALVAAVALWAGTAPALRAEAPPRITKLKLEHRASGVVARIYGERFGVSPTKLPCVKCAINEMQVIVFTGDNEPFENVTIKDWTDKYIELTDIAPPPPPTLVFAVKNDTSGKTVSATANVPGGAAAPVIRRLVFFRDHRRLKVRVQGSGFGPAPSGVPGNTDIEYFQFWIWVTNGDVHNYPWSAGHGGNTVSLKYESWTDSQIIIGGFGEYYNDGIEDWTVHPGDAVAITLYNNPGGGAFGPSTGKAARIPTQ